MKQFIVDRHTTPNTPTLEQVPTEKVPIYETLAAAESDLANLNAGQIIATPDTGAELANVTDTVQAGNMHAVTSNAVAAAIGKNGLGTSVDISGYIEGQSRYTCQSDGYVRCYTGDTTLNRANIIINGIIVASARCYVNGYSGTVALFVKKGMQLSRDSGDTISALEFIPIE